MKKLVIAISLIMVFTAPCGATTALYRISSNEIYIIDPSDTVESPSEFYATIDDATYPDGLWCRDSDSQLRVEGFAKILDGTVVRNATPAEIATFEASELDDINRASADDALEFLKNDPKYRKLFYALVRLLVNEINVLRAEHGMADRTVAQAKTALENAISKND